MTRLYYCRECGYRFESNEQEDTCWECCSENLMNEATFDSDYAF